MGGTVENPYAGQGPVLLDIGGDVGALVVVMPSHTEGLEVELRPVGTTEAAARAGGSTHPGAHPGAHHHHHDHDHDHDEHDHDEHDHRHHDHHGGPAADHAPEHAAYPHVGVVGRPDGADVVHSLVYPSVPEGEYELYVLPDGPVAMTAWVRGGQVTRNRWPA